MESPSHIKKGRKGNGGNPNVAQFAMLVMVYRAYRIRALCTSLQKVALAEEPISTVCDQQGKYPPSMRNYKLAPRF